MFNDIKVGDKVIVKSYSNTYRNLAYYKGTVVSVSGKRFTVTCTGVNSNLTFLKSDGGSYPSSDRYQAYRYDNEVAKEAYSKNRLRNKIKRLMDTTEHYYKCSEERIPSTELANIAHKLEELLSITEGIVKNYNIKT